MPGASCALMFRLATALLKPWPMRHELVRVDAVDHDGARGVLVVEALELLREGAAEREGEAGERNLSSFGGSKTLTPRWSAGRM